MQYLEPYITAKLATGLAPKTVSSYEWLLGKYTKFCDSEGYDPNETLTVERFLAQARRHGYSPASVHAFYRALHAYFNWKTKRGLLEKNPLEVVDKPRLPRRRTKRISRTDFVRLYHGIKGDEWYDNRDRAMLIIMFFSGLRVGELIALRSTDIDTVRNTITIRSGKGGHERDVPCPDFLAPPLSAYLYTCPEYKKTALWLSNDGAGGVRGVLTADGVRMLLRRRCADVGLPYYNPHSFRHGFATTLLNAGLNMGAVSAALGHSSVITTEQIYAIWEMEGLSQQYVEALKKVPAP